MQLVIIRPDINSSTINSAHVVISNNMSVSYDLKNYRRYNICRCLTITSYYMCPESITGSSLHGKGSQDRKCRLHCRELQLLWLHKTRRLKSFFWDPLYPPYLVNTSWKMPSDSVDLCFCPSIWHCAAVSQCRSWVVMLRRTGDHRLILRNYNSHEPLLVL